MATPTRGRASAAAEAAGLTDVDFSAGTTVNADRFDGSTSWGTSSTIVAADQHGRLDTGLDAGVRFGEAIARPTGAIGFRLRVRIPNPPGSNGTGGNAGLAFGVARQNTLLAQEGYWSAFFINTGDTLKLPNQVQRWGSNVSLTATTVEGVLVADMTVYFEDNVASYAIAHMLGETTGGPALPVQSSDLGSTVTNLYPFWATDMAAASPSASLSWGAGCSQSYEWILPPA